MKVTIELTDEQVAALDATVARENAATAASNAANASANETLELEAMAFDKLVNEDTRAEERAALVRARKVPTSEERSTFESVLKARVDAALEQDLTALEQADLDAASALLMALPRAERAAAVDRLRATR